jgi:iodotyrosine deiodinase
MREREQKENGTSRTQRGRDGVLVACVDVDVTTTDERRDEIVLHNIIPRTDVLNETRIVKTMTLRQEHFFTAALTAAATTLLVSTWFRSGRKCELPSPSDRTDENSDFRSGQVEPSSPNGMGDPEHVSFHHERLSIQDIRSRSRRFLALLSMRRTIRFFSSDPVPKDVIEAIIETACTAPSGAHKQPWSFVAVSDPKIKAQIREMVEKEETLNYQRRMRKSWVEDVVGMVSQVHGDDEAVHKPYLTEAPWIIVVFKQPHGIDPTTNERIDHYYVQESVGIACGMLISAIQNANLATLTSTPMGAEKGIRNLLVRPDHEKVVLLMPVGFPADTATVPFRREERKPLDQVLFWKC